MRRWAAALLIAALLMAASSGEPCAAEQEAALPAQGKTLVGIALNGKEISNGTFIFVRGTQIYAIKSVLTDWGFKVPDSIAVLKNEGIEYVALNAIPGLSFSFDAANQELDVRGASRSFIGSNIDFRRASPAHAQDRGYGAYLNYSLYGSGPVASAVRGAFEIGISLPHGTLRDSFYDNRFPRGRISRLDTVYTSDDLRDRSTFTLGDALAIGGQMGTPSRFAGLQWATNFSVDPTFIPYPTPVFFGTSQLPGTVAVNVNGAPVVSSDIQAGPFTLTNVPVVDGAGNVSIVVTDVLGQRHLISSSFYQTRALLKAGLTTHAYSVGFERDSSGSRAGHYGPLFAEGTLRHGFSDRFTGEAHVEHDAVFGSVVGAAADVSIGSIGIFSAGLAGSFGAGSAGLRAVIGYTYASRRFDVGLEDSKTSLGFREVGQDLSSQSRQSGQNLVDGHIGVRLNRTTSIGLTSSWVNTAALPSQLYLGASPKSLEHTTGLSLSKALGRVAVQFSLYRVSGGSLGSGTGGAVSLYMPVGENGELSTNFQKQPGTSIQPTVEFYRSGASDDLGDQTDYDFQSSPGSGGLYSLTAFSRTQHGDITGTIGTYGSQRFWDAGLSGGIVAAAHRIYSTRQIYSSFGYVELGFPHVRIYDGNRLVGRTDKHGTLVIPDLMPYFGNDIRADSRDLPMSVKADETITVDPMLRAGARILIPTRVEHSALISLVDTHGRPLLAGTVLTDAADLKLQWPVGEDGEAFISPIHSGEIELTANDGVQTCNARIVVPQHFEEGSSLGTVRCLPR